MRHLPGTNLLFMIRTAWRYAGEDRKKLGLFYGMFLIANIVLSFQPIVLAKLINTTQQGGPEGLKHALFYALLYGGLTLGFWLLHGPARLLERRAAFNISRRFIADLYRMITEMPLRWHQDHHTGSTINRIRKAERALMGFCQTQFIVIEIVVRLTVSTALLVLYSPWAAVASFAASIVIAVVIRRFNKILTPLARKTNEAEHHLSAALYDYIGNISTVLTLRMQGNTESEIGSRYEMIKSVFWREINANEWKWGISNLLLIATQMMIIGGYIILHMSRGHVIAAGSVVAIYQYLNTIMQQFFSASSSFEQLLYQSIDVHGVDSLKASHTRLVAAKAPAELRIWRKIHIRDLAFTHSEGEAPLHYLNDIDLALVAGQKIAFIGSSGSGKTTLLTLLRGLYEARSVKLDIDGEEFSSLAALSGFTTLIPQDSEVFENTVLYNLTLGTHVSDDVVQQAMSMAAFDEVLPRLPKGLDTDIRERGVNMSGGQKQRMALTRGLIAARDSSLLLLDEPTSSVDMHTENRIFERLFELYNDKTIIASVHRLHLLPRFDHIVLMQDGRIIEQGAFDDLMKRKGAFATVWLSHLTQADVPVA